MKKVKTGGSSVHAKTTATGSAPPNARSAPTKGELSCIHTPSRIRTPASKPPKPHRDRANSFGFQIPSQTDRPAAM
jgi:hypothetical protein